MKIFTLGKNPRTGPNSAPSENNGCGKVRQPVFQSNAGNIFFALFAAVAMVGAVGFGFNSVLKGPISGMTDVTRRTVAESTVVSSSRVAIVSAATQQTLNGDCDGDGHIEPMPYRDPAGKPAPVGGGWLPDKLIPDSIDPWKSEYGYCAWDSGSKIADPACGGATGRLAGSPHNNQYAIAIISAGKDRVFQTSCNAYVDTAPADGIPDTPLIVRIKGSDDIVLGYTYAEANNLGNGLWSPKTAVEAETEKGIAAKGATFTDGVDLMKGGLKLPTDDGSNGTTGPCNTANDKQMRLNTSTQPPTLEICDHAGGLGWSALSGGSGGGEVAGTLVSRWKFDESTGTIAEDSIGNNDGTFTSAPLWNPTGGRLQGAANVTGVEAIVADHASMKPTAITISGWIKRNGSSSAFIFKKFAAAPIHTSYGFNLAGGTDNRISFYLGTGGTNKAITGPAPIPDNTWTHLAASYDPNADTQQMKLYVNGTMVASRNESTPIEYDTQNFEFNAGHQFKGVIDDVRLYNYALTPAEIQKLSDVSEPGGMALTSPTVSGRLYGWGADTNASQGNGTNAALTNAPFALPNGLNYIQASAGISHGCGTKANGTVWCWGEQNYGKLGDGTALNAQEAVQIKPLKNIIKVSAGADHNCALDKKGRIWCWGRTDHGRLGNGVTTAGSTTTPQLVSDHEDFIDLATGYTSTCGIRKDNTVWCWGRGDSGQLGIGTLPASQGVPTKVTAITGFTQIDASVSTNSFCGTTLTGLGYCWGNETAGELGNGATNGANAPSLVLNIKDFTKIEIEAATACGLRAGGEIWCWGNDSYGALGNGTTAGNTTVPLKVVDVADFTDVSAGLSMGCGIRKNRDLWCWGRDDAGQLGTGSGDQTSHVPLQSLIKNVMSISMGSTVHLAITDERPIGAFPIDSGQGKIAVGYNFACMIKKDGTAWCWGQDTNGVLGNGAAITANQDRPSMITDPGPWMKLATGGSGNSVCGIKANGMLSCWGMDNTGQLAFAGSSSSQHSPVPSTDTSFWTKIALGGAGGGGSACGIKVDGTLWCWGSNANGRTGLGLTSGSTDVPAQVGTDTWTDVGVGFGQSCGVKSDGTGWCWGESWNGSIGNGPSGSADYSAPQQIADPGPWYQIKTMANIVCGIKVDGTLWCWGTDGMHTIGNGNDVLTAYPYVPTKVHSAQLWTHVSVGHMSVCALDVTGDAWCWGGAKGTGNGLDQTPARILGGIKFSALETVAQHVCGLDTGGNAWCWGEDVNGKLGNGPSVTADQAQPYPVADSVDPWIWDQYGTAFTPPLGVNPLIGNTRWIAPDTVVSQGFNFENNGKSRIVQNTVGNQLLLEATGNNNSAQLSFVAGGAKRAADVTTGLVLKYPMDASSGTTISASVGGYDMVGTNMTWQPAGGKVAGSLLLIPSSAVMNTRNPILEQPGITISLWVKPTNIGTAMTIFKKPDYSGTTVEGLSYAFTIDTTGNVGFKTGFNGSTDTLSSAARLMKGEWANIIGVYDPAIPPPRAQKRLYINGRLDASKILTQAIYYDSDFMAGLTLNDSSTLAMALDDFRLYSRGLEEDEISALYYFTSKDKVTYSMGLDAESGSLKFARNNDNGDAGLSALPADMEIAANGNAGIGTDGAPLAKLDVNGAIRIGNDVGGCSLSKAGTLRYTGGATPWEYCDGSWKPLGSQSTTDVSGKPWDTAWTSLSTGDSKSCAIKADGTAWCWGRAENGGLGNNMTTPNALTPVAVHSDSSSIGWNDWKMISADGYRSACGLRANGTAWCWGSPTHGQLGNGVGVGSFLRPAQVKNSTGTGTWNDWKHIVAGPRYTCGIRGGGSLWCWGASGSGEIGDNQSGAVYSLPVQVHSATSSTGWEDWVSVSVHMDHTCGLRSNGTAWCWGAAVNGALGNNQSSVNALRPVQVMDTAGTGTWDDWKSISTGYQNACGIRSNGTAWCWGVGAGGKNGNNDLSNKSTPNLVQTNTGPGGWSDWVYIAAGHVNNCGLRANGTAWCWGTQYYRGNGNSSISNSLRPTQVQTDTGATGWSDWVSIKPNYQHTCGVRANGTLWCWGTPEHGALGDGQIVTTKALPFQVTQ